MQLRCVDSTGREPSLKIKHLAGAISSDWLLQNKGGNHLTGCIADSFEY